MACPRADRERWRWSQSSGSLNLCPSEAHSDLYLAQHSSTPGCSCPAGLSWPALLVLTLGFPDPDFTKTLVAPQVWREMTGSIINPFTMQEMTAVDNCFPLYNLQAVVFVFSP